MKKAGIITMHSSDNYGAVLQTFALSEYLKKLNFNVEIINYIPRRFRLSVQFFYVHPDRCKTILHKYIIMIASLPIRILIKIRYTVFLKKYLKIGKKTYFSEEELEEDCPQYDYYITGSDQVWNTDFEGKVEPAFMLGFVPEEKIKIAFASSFGKDRLNQKEKQEIQRLLKRYQAISVREESGIEILKDLGIQGEYLVDPVLLLSKKEWKKKLNTTVLKEYKYILIYQLNPSSKIIQAAQKIAKEKKLKIVKFGRDVIKAKGTDINMSFRKPEDFVSMISNAEYIVTDSFHGTLFSIIFQKKFFCVLPPKYKNRIISILNRFDLQERLKLENYDKEIDYNKVEKIIQREKEKAKEFLKNIEVQKL